MRPPEAEQHGHVVHLAGVTGLDNQPDLGAGAFPHQMVVHRGDGKQRRDRAIVSSDSRSERIMMRAPSAIAADVCERTSSSAAFSRRRPRRPGTSSE
ncbi:hypothetical protein I553_8806 [Mycobacterium xenopi 4042]|uniref:Uncharacterized protein n=1 Tax=Mycobacterium xenopi 4042 TaxID=1299334 RepID=X8CK54_MYCXE|nr:hypothetical protein I553_8806 [Mycobacterium xenopi 4042]